MRGGAWEKKRGCATSRISAFKLAPFLFFDSPLPRGGGLFAHARPHTHRHPPKHTHTPAAMGLFGLFGGKKPRPPGDGTGALDDVVALPPLEPLTPRPPRPTTRPKLTDDDRDVFAYARDMTAGNVWCVEGGIERDKTKGDGPTAAARPGRRLPPAPPHVSPRSSSLSPLSPAQVLPRPPVHPARPMPPADPAPGLGGGRHRRGHAGVGARPDGLAPDSERPHARAPDPHARRCGGWEERERERERERRGAWCPVDALQMGGGGGGRGA